MDIVMYCLYIYLVKPYLFDLNCCSAMRPK